MNAPMEIGNYVCDWRYYGWTYTNVTLYEKKLVRGWLGRPKIKLKKIEYNSSDAVKSYRAEKMTPREIREWYESAISEYESYRDAWATEDKK